MAPRGKVGEMEREIERERERERERKKEREREREEEREVKYHLIFQRYYNKTRVEHSDDCFKK